MPTLYHLNAQEEALKAKGEEENLDPQVLADTIESIQGSIEEQLFSLIRVAQEEDIKIAAIKAKIKSMQSRIKSHENLSMRLKSTVNSTMQSHGWKSLENAQMLIRVRKNPASVEITDEKKLPADSFDEHIEYRPNKTRIKKMLLSGPVTGAILKQTTRLEVK